MKTLTTLLLLVPTLTFANTNHTTCKLEPGSITFTVEQSKTDRGVLNLRYSMELSNPVYPYYDYFSLWTTVDIDGVKDTSSVVMASPPGGYYETVNYTIRKPVNSHRNRVTLKIPRYGCEVTAIAIT